MKLKILRIIIILISMIALSGCSQVTLDTTRGYNETVNLEQGNVPVAIQDQKTIPINLYFSENLANITLVANTSIDDTVVTINSPIVPTTDMLLCLKEGASFYQNEINGVVSLGGDNYNISLKAPLDFAFTTAGGCSLRNHDLSVDGSTTPHYFTLSPRNLNVSWHINKIILHCEDNLAMDSGTFCGIPALPNGVIIRRVDGTIKNLLTIESNGDMTEHDMTVVYDPKAPAGIYSIYATKTFNGQTQAGVTLQLNNETNDLLEAIVQDDLTDNGHIHIVAIGHLVQD